MTRKRKPLPQSSTVNTGPDRAVDRIPSPMKRWLEQQNRIPYQWCSFAKAKHYTNPRKGFLGVIIIQAHDLLHANERIDELGINPGGEMMCWEIEDQEFIKRIPKGDIQRVLNYAEATKLYNAQHYGQNELDGYISKQQANENVHVIPRDELQRLVKQGRKQQRRKTT